MSGFCIPIPDIKSGHNTDISVSTSESSQMYRIELFNCCLANDSDLLVQDNVYNTLKNKIEQYDKAWELLQVFTPEDECTKVKVLFRKR